jgi:hypothetical protein
MAINIFQMNVLILTPDRVGSTLLQRLITVYAHINENYDPLTVNLHELTNGLVMYDNEKFSRPLLGKKENGWGYHQSLETIVNLLRDCGHDVVSRLAHYHIRNRSDHINDQLDFYRYLNDNFFIIAARRRNIFEHALSWSISVESKKLNVYSAQEKYDIYKDICHHGMNVQNDVMIKYLNAYTEYIDWVDRHFRVNCYFEYERDLPDIENFILNLNVFRNHPNPLTWADRFQISWPDWNRMHYLLSLVPFSHKFSQEEKDFMSANIDLYTECRIVLQDLQDQGILVSGIPIKLHTLHEKANLISNIDHCLITYNQWAGSSGRNFALSYDATELNRVALVEHTHWNNGDRRTLLTDHDITQQKLLASDLQWD